MHIFSKPCKLNNNVAITQLSHPLSSCRIYYSNIKLANDIATKYVTENRAKQAFMNVLYFHPIITLVQQILRKKQFVLQLNTQLDYYVFHLFLNQVLAVQ